MILPDFQNLYTNMSYLSREEQVRQFRMLVDRIQVQISDTDRYMQINLHGLLYSILSETNIGQTIFMAADTVSTGLVEIYSEQLRPDNILVTSELDDRMHYSSEEFDRLLKDYLDMLRREIPKQFTIMIFPYRMLEHDFEAWLHYIDDILAYRGRIILYDCPGRVSITDRFNLELNQIVGNDRTIKMLESKKILVSTEIYLAVTLRIRELQEDIIGSIDNDKLDTQEMDRLIYEAWALEKEITRYQDEFPNGKMKYRINEIKNALLDLRYCDEIDLEFFSEVLRKESQITI